MQRFINPIFADTDYQFLALTITADKTICREQDGDSVTLTFSQHELLSEEPTEINFSLSGDAVVETDYTLSEESGSLVIPAGSTSVSMTLNPVWKTDRTDKTVTITITKGEYVTADISKSVSITLAEVVAASPFTWYPRGQDLHWSNADNWYGYQVPGINDIAVFDGLTSEDNCDIDVNINTRGILITGYTGTITQEPTRTIQIGSSGYSQHSGTFQGGDSEIMVNAGPWTIAAGTFNAGSTTVRFWNTLTITGSHTLYNVQIRNPTSNQNRTTTIADETTLTIAGTLTLTGTYMHSINGGDIAAQGNIVVDGITRSGSTSLIRINGAGAQTLSGSAGKTIPAIEIDKPSGILTLSGTIETYFNWTYTTGAIDSADSTVWFNNTLTITGSHTLYNVQIRNRTSNWTTTTTLADETTLTVEGALTLHNSSINAHNINTGTLEVRGDLSVGGRTNYNPNISGSATVVLRGDNDQYLTDTTTGGRYRLSNGLTIDKSGGQAILASNFGVHGSNTDLIWNNGGLNLYTNTLTVNRHVTIGEAATKLLTTVIDAETAGKVVANNGNITGLNNIELEVTIDATEAEVDSKEYVVVSGSNTLVSQFDSVNWNPTGWSGDISYVENDEKDATLTNIEYTP